MRSPAAPAPTAAPLSIGARAAAVLARLSPAREVGEDVSPHVVTGGGDHHGPDGHGPRRGHGGDGTPVPKQASRVRLGLAFISGLAGALLIVGTSPWWHLAPVAWRLNIPGLKTSGDSFFAASTFVIGIVLLALGWFGLVSETNRGRGSSGQQLKIVVVMALIWAAPFMLAPIQLSTDAYSYAAQGDLSSLGFDPSVVGPNKLPNHASSAFWTAADPIWRDTPAPYGPVAVGTEKAVVTVTGFDVSHAIWGFRVLAILGVVMTGFGVYVIARKKRVSAPLAVALAIANPLVLVHLIGGAHNDALMMGLLVLGLASFECAFDMKPFKRRAREFPASSLREVPRRELLVVGPAMIGSSIVDASTRLAANALFRKILGVVLITLAVGVKSTAVLALAFVAWNWQRGDVSVGRRVRNFAAVGAIFAGLTVALCVAVGIGFGWVSALRSTGSVYSTFSVFTKIGFVGADMLHAVGIHADSIAVVNIARGLGLIVAAALILLVLWRSPKVGVTRSVGLALLALMLCGPVIWPWYLPVGFALLAAAGIRRFRPTMIVLIIASSVFVFPTSVDPIQALARYQHWLGFGVVLLIVGLCAAAQYVARLSENRQGRLTLSGVKADQVLVAAGAAPAANAASATAAVSSSTTRS